MSNKKKNKLRNYFAGKALQGLLSNPKYFSCDKHMILEEKISERAFKLADDMVERVLDINYKPC
jgi:hypothetical protein